MEPIQVAEIRSKGWSYRAEMYPIYKPSYVGAAPLTKYFVFDRKWIEVPYNELPNTAYQALRRALRADIAKGPMRDPVRKASKKRLTQAEMVDVFTLMQGGENRVQPITRKSEESLIRRGLATIDEDGRLVATDEAIAAFRRAGF